MKKYYLIIFTTTFLFSVASVFAYFFLITPKTNKAIKVAPISLQITQKNDGKRCDKSGYEDSSENPLCYKLQEKLSMASWNGNLEAIKYALRFGANVNAPSYQGDSAIDAAVLKGKKDAVVLLIENGADVNKTKKWGISPLQTAVIYNQKEITQILLENNADVCHAANLDDGTKSTALTFASEEGHTEIASLLKEYGGNICYSRFLF